MLDQLEAAEAKGARAPWVAEPLDGAVCALWEAGDCRDGTPYGADETTPRCDPDTCPKALERTPWLVNAGRAVEADGLLYPHHDDVVLAVAMRNALPALLAWAREAYDLIARTPVVSLARVGLDAKQRDLLTRDVEVPQ